MRSAVEASRSSVVRLFVCGIAALISILRARPEQARANNLTTRLQYRNHLKESHFHQVDKFAGDEAGTQSDPLALAEVSQAAHFLMDFPAV